MSQLSPKNQTEMLASVLADGSKVAIFLVNGIRLVGQIEAFDQYIVVLRSSAGTQTIYKHAISTVQVDTNAVDPLRTRVHRASTITMATAVGLDWDLVSAAPTSHSRPQERCGSWSR
jgi:host factor-I protein